MSNTKRINSIDFFRIISCFLIVCIHLNFYEVGTVRWYSRFAVLFFFVISGYFFTLCNEEKQIVELTNVESTKGNRLIKNKYDNKRIIESRNCNIKERRNRRTKKSGKKYITTYFKKVTRIFNYIW